MWRWNSTSHADARSLIDRPAMRPTKVVTCKPCESVAGPLAHLQQPLLHGEHVPSPHMALSGEFLEDQLELDHGMNSRK